MVKLILAGGGDASDSKLLDEFFINLIPKGKEMLYIPVAMPKSEHSFDECYEWIKSTFNKLKFTKITIWTDLKNKNYKDLEQFGAIYIGGGNSFSLLNELKKTRFIKLLIKFIKEEKIVYGGSAGAIILGKDISTAELGKYPDKNLVNLKDLSGLNLIKDFNIHCHYEEKYNKNILEYIKKNKCKIIAIPEKSGLFVEDKKIKVIGYRPIFLFKENKKFIIKPNKTIKINNL